MIKHLKMSNVGPAPKMELEFGERLNLLTGDNGLGKSFLLDIAWWALTRRWPAEINPQLTSGRMARPTSDGESKISFSIDSKTKEVNYESKFLRKEQVWKGKPGRPLNPGLVLYAMSDGSFAVWDPSRNYWLTRGDRDVQERVPAYVFSPKEIWDGLQNEDEVWLCNGLIRDWAIWKKERSAPFTHLKQALEVLSPSADETLEPGSLTRVSLDDVRDIPTIRMPYQQDVAVIHASSGMRRIMAMAYLLAWAWKEHKQAAKQLGEPATKKVTFLIDEIESHLHPSWQRSIVPAVLSVTKNLMRSAEVQLIAATHSPLVMASAEPLFDAEKDAWFDLDFERKKVVLRRRSFEKHGDAANWLISEAFDLKSSRSIEYERLVEKASALLDKDQPSEKQIFEMHDKLVGALGPKDEFLFRWLAICDKRGLL